MVSPHGLRPCPAPHSPVVPPADVCPLRRGRQRVPVCGCDRQLRGAEIRIANVSSGSAARVRSFKRQTFIRKLTGQATAWQAG